MPKQAALRRDPPNTGKGISTNHGFTVVELMMTIAVVAIITSLALPSYRTIMEKRQVTSGAEQLAAFVSSAQLEAVKRNESIAVRYMRTDTDTWCLGLVPIAQGTTSNTPCDCTLAVGDASACKIDGQLRVFSDVNLNHPDVLNSVTGDGAFAFEPIRGSLNPATDVASWQLLSPDEHKYALDVEVTATGRVRICSNTAADKDVPGYKEC